MTSHQPEQVDTTSAEAAGTASDEVVTDHDAVVDPTDDTTAAEVTDGDAADGDATDGAADRSSTRSTAPADLEKEGEIAADYLEDLLDIADLDGDIDMDVERDRALVSVVGGDLDHLVGRRRHRARGTAGAHPAGRPRPDRCPQPADARRRGLPRRPPGRPHRARPHHRRDGHGPPARRSGWSP